MLSSSKQVVVVAVVVLAVLVVIECDGCTTGKISQAVSPSTGFKNGWIYCILGLFNLISEGGGGLNVSKYIQVRK